MCEERYNVGKYASQNEIAAAVRHYQSKYKNLNESTVRGFKNHVKKELKIATKNKSDPWEKSSIQVQRKPLILGGETDQKVQLYIKQVGKRAGVISRSITISTAKVLLERDESFDKIKITETWAKSFLKRIGSVRRAKTPSTVEIPDDVRKELEYLYLYGIESAVEKWNIPPDLPVNFDQAPSKLVPVSHSTLVKRNSTNVTIASLSDKRTITVTLAVSLSGNFLPPQLICGKKTTQSLPKYEFSKSFSISLNPAYYSNSQESIKFIEAILVPLFHKETAGFWFDCWPKGSYNFPWIHWEDDSREVIETHN